LLSTDADVFDQAMDRTAGLYGALQNYSRQQELQADACSVRMAGRIADIKLDQMIDSYVDSIAQTTPVATQQNNNQDAASVAALPDLPLKKQSGHPEYPERRQRMKEVSQQVGLPQN
jgi:predicted Zn-dependent protease